MKKVYVFFVFICLSFTSFAQETQIGIQIGAGSFSMEDFKSINKSVLVSLPFEARITSDFPMNIVYKIYHHTTFKNDVGLGLKYSFSSSGSLVSREDYSGSYSFKNQVHYYSPGFVFDYCLYTVKGIKILQYNEFGWEFSWSTINEKISVYSESTESTTRIRSTNMFIEPGLKVVSPFAKNFIIGLYAGYLFDSHGEFKEANTPFKFKELYTLGRSGTSINWSGIRFGVSFSVRIPD